MIEQAFTAWPWLVAILGGAVILGLMLAFGQWSWLHTRFGPRKEQRRNEAIRDLYHDRESERESPVRGWMI